MASLKLYTTGNMEVAVCDSATTEATGHPKENLYDNNLDTYWKPTGDPEDVQLIDFDLQESKWISHVIIFVKNYKSIASGNYDIWYSSNGSSWFTLASNHTLIDTATPLRISTNFYNNYRYWRIVFKQLMQTIRVSAVWWARIYTINLGSILPQEDEDQFHGCVSQLPGGRLSVAGLNRNRVENFKRRYLIKSGDADFTDLHNAFQVSRGQRHPLIMNEGASQSDARVVRFADDVLPRPVVGYDGLHEIEIGLRGIPYIDDGDSY